MYCKQSDDSDETIDEDDRQTELMDQKDKNEDNSGEQLECNFCDQTFETKLKFLKHLKSDHKMVKPIVESIPFPELVESVTTSDRRIKCGKCCFSTDSEAEMILHSVNHNVIVVTEGKSSIKEKFRSKLKCPSCQQLFSKSLLQKHIYIHISEKRFQCEECSKEFTSFQAMSNHKRRHKTSSDPLVSCEICCTSFASKKGLQKHRLIHQKDRPKSHLCDICGVGFYDRESLKSHTFRIHLPKNSRKFKCDFDGCRYTCLYQHQMLEHKRIHSDDKPWACDQCDYTAKSKWTFKKHYRKHTKEKPFRCSRCDYASSLSSNLTRHLRIHTGSKPFKCPYCSYSCNNHENLRKHVLNTQKHKGLYLYNCTHCMFATNVFSDLRRHIEQSHNDIYSIEQIDRMISSIYHKHEDNTSVMSVTQTNTENSIKTRKNKKKNKESAEMVLPILDEDIQESEDSDQLTPEECEDNQMFYEIQNIKLENKKNINSLIGRSSSQNNSEIIVIDSNVLEAQEVCVQTKDNQILISISK